MNPSDRKSLIRLASELPKGSPDRKALLEVLAGSTKTATVLPRNIAKLVKPNEKKFLAFLEDPETIRTFGNDLDELLKSPGKVTPSGKDGRYEVELPGGGLLNEWASGYDNMEAEEAWAKFIADEFKLDFRKVLNAPEDVYYVSRGSIFIYPDRLR